MGSETQVQVKDKFYLTMDEASEYFNMGEKRLRQIVADNIKAGFVVKNGVKIIIKRRKS